MDSETARKSHQEARTAQEAGKFLEALTRTDEALLAYDAAGDIAGYAEGLANRANALRTEANLRDSRNMRLQARGTAMAAVEVAKEAPHESARMLPLYNLAQAQEDLGEFPAAIENYKEAIKTPAPERHSHPSVKLNIQIALGTCMYRAGDHSGLEQAEVALSQLEQMDVPDAYAKDVWVSGGHLRFATALNKNQPEKARKHFKRASDIADANPALIVRRQQIALQARSFA